MSKVYSFCFLFFYFNCSTYVTREQPPGATFPFSRAKVQKINEICNLIPQNIFYRVYLTPAIHVIALNNTSPILAGSYGSQTISDEGSDYDYENTGTGFIGFGKDKCDDPE